MNKKKKKQEENIPKMFSDSLSLTIFKNKNNKHKKKIVFIVRCARVFFLFRIFISIIHVSIAEPGLKAKERREQQRN